MIDLATVHLLSNVPAELLALHAANKLLTVQNSTLVSKNNNLQIGFWILGGATLIGAIYLFIKLADKNVKQNGLIIKPVIKKPVQENPSVKTITPQINQPNEHGINRPNSKQ